MEQILDFARAAAPWVAMGLLIAIFAVRMPLARKKAKNKRTTTEQKVCSWECASALRLEQPSETTLASAFRSECSRVWPSGCAFLKEKRIRTNETETGNQAFDQCRTSGAV